MGIILYMKFHTKWKFLLRLQKKGEEHLFVITASLFSEIHLAHCFWQALQTQKYMFPKGSFPLISITQFLKFSSCVEFSYKYSHYRAPFILFHLNSLLAFLLWEKVNPPVSSRQLSKKSESFWMVLSILKQKRYNIQFFNFEGDNDHSVTTEH